MGTFILCCARMRVAPYIFSPLLVVAFFLPHTSAAQTLTLNDAFMRAAAADPALPASEARINAAQAGIQQANTRPNPRVMFELENFAGTGPIGAFDQSVTTLSYSQTIERGNKREARTSLARAGLQAVQLERQIHALNLFESVEVAWIEAVAAESGIVLNQERLAAVQRLQAETKRRVAAAREPAFASARVGALLAETEIALASARSNAQMTKASLAAYWDGPPGILLDPSWLERREESPEISLVDNSADLALFKAERQSAGARLGLEEARAVQDPTFAGGVRHSAIGNALALVASVAIPIPFYNDNSGNISRALAEREAADREYAAQRRNLQREITTLQARVAAYATESEAIELSSIPQSKQSLALIYDGFERGAFEYIDIIEAERNLNNAKTRRLDILRSYHLDLARLNRLTGRYAFLISGQEIR
jgi:cobalt-zinc-cadmium efflux system outer membrane protein